MIDVYSVGSSSHSRSIVALSKLAESREASETHPDLESLILLQFRVVSIRVSVWISLNPIRGHEDISPIVLALAVKLAIALP